MQLYVTMYKNIIKFFKNPDHNTVLYKHTTTQY